MQSPVGGGQGSIRLELVVIGEESGLMMHEIGDGAGKLWHYLEKNPASTLEEAAKSLKLKENLVAMAAGWLAREDKIAVSSNGKLTTFSLKSK